MKGGNSLIGQHEWSQGVGGRTVVGGGGGEEVLQRKGEEKRTRQHNQNIQRETGGTRNAIESMQPRGW